MEKQKSSTSRILKTVALVIAMYAIASVIESLVISNSGDYNRGVSLLVIIFILALTAPKVGYRWFDALFALIPIYGIFFIFRIAYRLAYLPNRDWDELTP